MKFTNVFAAVFLFYTTAFAGTFEVYDTTINANETVHWKTGDTLILMEQVWVESGARLNIDSGVVIKAKRMSGTNHASLIICQNARIYAIGTRTKPIIFTSIDDDFLGADGLIDPSHFSSSKMWGGLVLLGNAPVCGGIRSFEAAPNTEPRNRFGGDDPHDTSGVLTYVSLRFGGAEYGPNQEINQVTFCGVGDGTIVDYVESFNSGDDAFEWFGGTVNTKHLVAFNSRDDLFDTDWGYKGNGQFWVGYMGNGIDLQGSKCGEHSAAYCQTFDQIFNVANATYIAANVEVNTLGFTEDLRGRYVNSIFYSGGSQIEYSNFQFLSRNMEAGEMVLGNNLFWGPDSNKFKWLGKPISYWVTGMGAVGVQYELLAQSSWVKNPKMQLATDYGSSSNPTGIFDLRPSDDSAAYSRLYDITAKLDTTFFERVCYRGAFDPSQDTAWWRGWTALDLYGYLSSSDVKKLEKRECFPVAIEGTKPGMNTTVGKFSKAVLSGKNLLNIDAAEDANVRILSLQGKVLKSFPVKRGISSSSVNMITGNYLLEIKGVKTSMTTLLNVMQ